jgi:hypothetical protein
MYNGIIVPVLTLQTLIRGSLHCIDSLLHVLMLMLEEFGQA